MNISLEGKVAIVTGGSGAIGGAICDYYVEAGAKIVIVGMSMERGEKAVERLKAKGGDVVFFQGSVADRDKMEEMAQFAVDTYGKIDILVNNAGVNVGPDGRTSIENFSTQEWDRIINTDLNGIFHCSSPVIKRMAEKKYGRIINISSVVGCVPFRNQCAFTAAKAGVINLTKAMAIELAEKGILVNAICPGSIMFEGTKALFYSDKERAERMMSHIPLGRPGEPHEIAGSATLLASDEITYMTGNIMVIDGGWICGFARDF